MGVWQEDGWLVVDLDGDGRRLTRLALPKGAITVAWVCRTVRVVMMQQGLLAG